MTSVAGRSAGARDEPSDPVVVVVGSLNSDQQIALPALPRPGETVLAIDLQVRSGGKGANQAAAVALAGARCWMVGAVGQDTAGAAMLADLERVGALTGSVLRRRGVALGSALVMVDQSGENSIVVVAGANGAIGATDVRDQCEQIGPIDVLVTQAELSAECLDAAAAAAQQAGARFVLNLAPYRSVDQDVLGRCDPLVVNEHEAAALAADLTGGPVPPAELLALLAQHAQSVVITLGGDGAEHAVGPARGRVEAPAVRVVDTSGAGDAFVGALAVELARSADLATACAAGVAAGSRAVQQVGARAVEV